jgi:hypothetical protein
MKLPPPPPEVPASNDMLLVAPVFAAKVFGVVKTMERQGFDPIVFEAFRSDARATYLAGFGRDYDDGRGIVTNALDAKRTWHRYGLAVDIISKTKEWDAPERFWAALADAAKAEGLAWGGTWKFADKPHVQWVCDHMLVSPSDYDWQVLQSRGCEGIWREYQATWDTQPPRAA